MHRPQLTRLTAAVTASITATALAIACATGSNAIHLHEISVEVKNNLAVPTLITVYAVSPEGSRRLGDVPPGDSARLRWVPPSNAGTYRFVAERALERPIRSQPFSVGSDNTGVITWFLVPNILAFREPDQVDTVHVDSAGVR